MTRPVRLQLSRKAGFDLQAHSRAVNGLPAISVARPSKWGNPYKVGDPQWSLTGHRMHPMTQLEAVEKHRLRECTPCTSSAIVAELRGKNIACWCGLDESCHGDNYLNVANAPIRLARRTTIGAGTGDATEARRAD